MENSFRGDNELQDFSHDTVLNGESFDGLSDDVTAFCL